MAWRRPAPGLGRAARRPGRALLLTSPSYFAHYGTYVAPALVLLAGAGADAVLGAVEARTAAFRPLVPALGLVALAVLSAHVVTQPEGRRVPAALPRTPSPACAAWPPTAPPPWSPPTCSPATSVTAAGWSSTSPA